MILEVRFFVMDRPKCQYGVEFDLLADRCYTVPEIPDDEFNQKFL